MRYIARYPDTFSNFAYFWTPCTKKEKVETDFLAVVELRSSMEHLSKKMTKYLPKITESNFQIIWCKGGSKENTFTITRNSAASKQLKK